MRTTAKLFALAAAAVLALSGCDLIASIFIPPASIGTIQVLQGSADLTQNGTYSFASATAGTLGDTAVFTIKNTGKAAVSINYADPVALDGTTDFSVVALPAATSIDENADVTFSVRFEPQSVGSRSATITVNTSVGVYTFTVTGTGTASGQALVEYSYSAAGPWSTTVAFGDVVDVDAAYSGAPVTPAYFRVTNIDSTDNLYIITASATLSSIVPAGGYSNNYTYYLSGPIPPSSSSIFQIDHNFTSDGSTDTATATLITSDGTHSTFTFTLSGSSFNGGGP